MQPPTDELVSDGNNYILEEFVIDTGNYDQYQVKWDNNFAGGVSIGARGQLNGIPCTSVSVQKLFTYLLL